MNKFETINPSTEEKLSVYRNMTDGEILKKIENLEIAFQAWRTQSVDQRLEHLTLLKINMQKKISELSLLVTQTMGKPLVESKLEIEKSISQIDFYLTQGPAFIREQFIQAHYPDMRLHFLPMGIVFAIMPWNYPVWQFFRFAIGAWLTGNVILLKHSEITTEVGVFLERLISELNGPLILQTLIISPKQSEAVFAHKSIQAVTFTGSSRVGREIGRLSGQHLKKCVLELGGNDAFVVDTSADLKLAVQLAVKGRLTNNGQSCIASKRFFVPTQWADEFLEKIEVELASYSVGDPLDKNTRLGPLAHKKFYDEYQQHCEFLKSITTTYARGVSTSLSKGYFVSPYFFLLDQKCLSVSVNRSFFQEQEVFSPIGMVVTYDSEDELFEAVNASPYGLGFVWVGDREKFRNEKHYLKYNVGMIAVNDILKSDPRVPFGGVKESGFGRESGAFGIQEFCNVQSLGIK